MNNNNVKTLYHIIHNGLAISNTSVQRETAESLDPLYKKIPTYFGEYLYIDEVAVPNLVFTITLLNLYSSGLNFIGLPTDDKYQLWIRYLDSNGNTLAKPNTSTGFLPESITVLNVPSGTYSYLQEYTYTFIINNLHFEKPNNASYWALYFRPVDNLHGTIFIEGYTGITNFHATIYPN